MKIIDKKKFIRSSLILILIIIILIFIIIRLIIGNSGKKSDTQQVSSPIISENTNIKQEEQQNVQVKEDSSNKTQETFSSNNGVKTYKINEKNIKLPILIYHAFQTPVPKNEISSLYSTEKRFEENVKTLLDNGYTFITLEDMYKYKNGEIGLPEKNITITMDDGWKGCYTEAYKVLKKYNVPATIFIIENLVGKEGYFTWQEAKEMYDSGLVKIHVHGAKHIDYSKVNKQTLISDYNKTHSKIEEVLGEKVQKIMAYPSGASSANSIKWLKDEGFEVQVQTKYGKVNKSNSLDLTGLSRVRGEQATGKTILKAIQK